MQDRPVDKQHAVQTKGVAEVAGGVRFRDLDLVGQSDRLLCPPCTEGGRLSSSHWTLLVPCVLPTLHLRWSQCLFLHHCFHQAVPGPGI